MSWLLPNETLPLANKFSKDLFVGKNARVQWIIVLWLSSLGRFEVWNNFGLIFSPIKWGPGYLPFLTWGGGGGDFWAPRECEICKVWNKQNTRLLRPAGASNWKATEAATRTAPDKPALKIWRNGPLLMYKLSWYITKRKKKQVGQEAAFWTSEETVRIHPCALMPKFLPPHPATLSRTLMLSESPGGIRPEFIRDLWKHFSNWR